MRWRQDIDFRELLEGDEEDRIEREIRRREANWEYINKLPPKLRAAVILFIEGGFTLSSKNSSSGYRGLHRFTKES